MATRSEGGTSGEISATSAAKLAPKRDGYVVPVVHARIPEPVVDLGFFGLLAGTVAFGAVDAPLAALIGAGVLLARHRGKH
jgi:hypothetical protein